MSVTVQNTVSALQALSNQMAASSINVANAKMIQAEDETIGTLLDITG